MIRLNRSSPALWLGLLALTGWIALLVNLTVGAHDASLMDAARHLWADDGSNAAFSLRELRLPRALCALLVGAQMAVSGLLIQVVVRNPLGDPGLTGVSGGAAFAVALGISLGGAGPSTLIPAGIVGGMIAACLTLILALTDRRLSAERVILAGIAISMLTLAGTGMMMIVARGSMRTLYFWMVGGFQNRTWVELTALLPWGGIGLAIGFGLTSRLNMLSFGDDMARSMGLNSARWRALVGGLSVVLAASAVAVAGPIGFIGFLAPHLARLMLGVGATRHEILLPVAMVTGAVMTLCADTATRALFDNKAPAGIVLAVAGGLIFLALAPGMLRRGRAS